MNLEELRAWVGPRPALANAETEAVRVVRDLLDTVDDAIAKARGKGEG